MKKRVLSLLMSAVLCLSALPTAAFAEDTDVTVSDGTSGDSGVTIGGGGSTGGEWGGDSGTGGGGYNPGGPTGGGGIYTTGEETGETARKYKIKEGGDEFTIVSPRRMPG